MQVLVGTSKVDPALGEPEVTAAVEESHVGVTEAT